MSTFEYVFLVILIYGSLAAAIIYFAIKKTRLFMILLGIVAILGAIPIGMFAEVGINGCCGAPSTGHEGSGFVIGALMGVVGITLLVFSSKFKKKKLPK